MEYLDKKLYEYGCSDFYPFHMPGHKRQIKQSFLENPYQIDITEIEGFDNLHHPEGILKESQEYAAGLYGTEKTYFLINGSTAGLLAAISASVSRGGKLLMARNCHKAVYHGAYLRGAGTVYLYPSYEETYGLNGGIAPEEVEKALEADPEVEAVLLTSPTYDGMVSPIEEIARIVHKKGRILIVDEAHGAHLPFAGEGFPSSAIALGADLVIQSLHKTLPSLTQTALLHVCSKKPDTALLERFLGIYQSSSPSYVLMAGIVSCLRFLEDQGERAFASFKEELWRCRKRLGQMENLELLGEGLKGKGNIADTDPSKLLISGKKAGLGGRELARILRERYHLEMEMEAENYLLALTSVSDTAKGFCRLGDALFDLDRELESRRGSREEKRSGEPEEWKFINGKALFGACQVCPISQGLEKKRERIRLEESRGRVSAEYTYLYPPGIPLFVPGERIEKDFLEKLFSWKEQGLSLQGLEDYTQETIWVLAEEK